VEPEPGLQVLPVLPKDVKRGYLTVILGKIRNGLTPSDRDVKLNMSTNLRSHADMDRYKICKIHPFVNSADY